VVIRCRKGGRARHPPPGACPAHATGIFTDAAEAILRQGAALDDVLPAG
jgi:hypothetical protein